MSVRNAVAPVLVLGLGVLASTFLLQGQPAARPLDPAPEPPAASVVVVSKETLRLRVRSQGTVAPRTESELVAEVPGKVLRIGRGLEPGAFFRAGELLAELDPRDLELAAKRARAALTRARAEEEFAAANLARQQALLERGIASDAVIDETRRAARIATARRREAEVDLERAERDLARTKVFTPFDGRTRSRSIDVGRYVTLGTPLARVYAVDYAEVRLPVPDAEIAYLDLPLGQELADAAAPAVELRAAFAGREHTWSGQIVRTEAEIDPRTRMVTVIARVPEPYAPGEGGVRPPLAAGLFVEAEIEGRRAEGVVRVPRSAVADGELWVVDAEDRLRRRRVEVLRFERDTALVASGLAGGERVSLLDPRRAREGQPVRPVERETLAQRGAPSEEEPAS